MRVCVVGGTGNISTSIVRVLLEQGHEVTCFTRGESGKPHGETRHIVGDRQDRATFERVMQEGAFDAAFDMICFSREDAESNIRAFRGVQHFVYCSTVCTYGVNYDWLPVSEDHPLRPTTDYGKGKAEADAAFLEAFYREGFPVTIIKPSTTYGPMMGMPRQVAWDLSWIDRVRKGRPLLVCGDGLAIHQFLHVDDAARGFAGVLGRAHCIGQTYNIVRTGFVTWAEHHRTAMSVLQREVELIGVPLADLIALEVPEVGICRDIYAYNTYYSNEKIVRDIPDFRPSISLEEGMGSVIAALDREGRIPNSDDITWEDRIIEAQRTVRRRP